MPRAALVTLLAVMGLLWPPIAHADRAVPVPSAMAVLPGSSLPFLSRTDRVAPLPSGRTMTLTVEFQARQTPLDHFLAAVYDRSSPLYHHFLTPRQFAARFGPLPAQRATATRWLQRSGFRLIRSFANGMAVQVRGTVGVAERTFGTRISAYHLAGERFFANTGPLRLPAAVASVVSDVAGLNNAARARPDLTSVHRAAHDDGPFGLTPKDIAQVYDLTPLQKAGLTGKGMTVGLYELADFQDKNIATYDQQFGISAGSIQRVLVRAGGSLGGDLVDEAESELDIEIVHAVAPGANIVVYEAPNTDAGAIAVWNQMVSDNKVQVMSASWGSAEEQNTDDDRTAMDTAFKEAAAQGESIFNSSGDRGAYANPDHPQELSTIYPASDPWLTAVGGTTLHRNYDGTYDSEQAWSEPSQGGDPVGSGGGLSYFFSRPAYQAGPGVDNTYSTGKRQIPDISADADPDRSPYAIYSIDDNGNIGWLGFGGTSASSPLWASYAALLAESSGSRLGFLNPALYQLGEQSSRFAQLPFHDVTQGTNLYYPATAGWDFATGWGSLDGAALLADMEQLTAASPTATPIPSLPATSPTTVASPPPAQPTPAPGVRHVNRSPSLTFDWLRAVNSRGQRTVSFRRGERMEVAARYSVAHAGGPVPLRLSWSYRFGTGRNVLRAWGSSAQDQATVPDGAYVRSRRVVVPKVPGTLQVRVEIDAAGQTRQRSVSVRIH